MSDMMIPLIELGEVMTSVSSTAVWRFSEVCIKRKNHRCRVEKSKSVGQGIVQV